MADPNYHPQRLIYKLDDHHNPVLVETWAEWADWYEQHEADRQVALTEVSGTIAVSTIFLAVVHGFFDKLPPYLFETAVFRDGKDIDVVDRYRTWDEAAAGHQAIVERLTP